MAAVPFIASDPALLDTAAPLVRSCPGLGADLVMVGNVQEAVDFLAVEMPDLAFINFSDAALDSFGLLDRMQKDPWLLHSSIIALCDDDSGERLEQMRGANIVIALQIEDLDRRLPKVLDIIANNKRILFQRGIGADLVQTISSAFKLQNDTIEVNCYVNLLCNYLYSANKIDAAGKMHVHVSLTEMLLNAVEHGNCGISYDEKGAWLEDGKSMSQLIEKKCHDPTVAAKRVAFEYTIAPDKTTFHIADEGPGFDWRRQKDAVSSGDLHAVHGRGIRMTRKYTQNLQYNERGNALSFEVPHAQDCINDTPALFENLPPIAVKKGDIVIREGEPSDFLYYIAKGHYDVLVHGIPVSTLSPDDIFMGEMSFLLHNRRSATVRATSDGTLIRISKKDFVAAIKQKPHYALFLARLLAQRLQRRHPATDDVMAMSP
jgi:hypothetical protein